MSANPTIYLLFQLDLDQRCRHERAYRTREAAELNLHGMLVDEYKTFLKQHAARLPIMPGRDPSPKSFMEWAEDDHGWSIEDVDLI